MVLKWLGGLALVIVLATALWASDRVTWEGERTVYTVRCEQGVWEDLRCTGTMIAGERHRFKASRHRQEVLYWIVGSAKPSGKYANCKVQGRGNWKCDDPVGAVTTIAREMLNDRPVPDAGAAGLPFHAVAKWRWWLLGAGIHWFDRADY